MGGIVADKFSVLIKHEHFELINNADLSNDEYRLIMNAIYEYDKIGKIPEFKDRVLKVLFSTIKSDLDKNRKKWEETVQIRSEAGKRGMEARWRGKHEITQITDNNKNNTDSSDNTCYQDITDITNITDSDLDSVNEFENGGGNDSPPPQLIQKIQQESKRLGFTLDKELAAKAAASGIDPPWLERPLSFPEFVHERLAENPKYRNKTPNEMTLLFAAAFAWENLRLEYPKWKQEKKHELEELEKLKFLEAAKKNHPVKCEYCGHEDLQLYDEKYWCKECGASSTFNEKKIEWEWRK